MRGVVIIAILTAVSCQAQDFTKGAGEAQKVRPAITGVLEYDTIAPTKTDSVALSGFDKALHSTLESVFVTNHSAHHLSGVLVEITYRDLGGRMLHRVKRRLSVDLPSGETRRTDFPSFDRQEVFYYKDSPAPRSAEGVTAFAVTMRPVGLIKIKE